MLKPSLLKPPAKPKKPLLNKTRDQVALLKLARSERLERLATLLRNSGNAASLEKDLETINRLQAAIDAGPKPWVADFLLTFIVSAVCVAIIAGLYRTKLDKAQIEASVDTLAVFVTSAGDWTPSEAIVLSTKGPIYIRDASSMDLRGFAPSKGLFGDPTTIEVTAAKGVSVEFPAIVAGDKLSISCLDFGQAELTFTWTNPTTVNITTSGKATIGGDASIESQSADDPSTLLVQQTSQQPLTVVAPLSGLRLALAGPISALSFDRLASAPGSAVPLFDSSIEGGSLRFVDVDQSNALSRFEHLSLEGISGTVEIVQTKSCVKLSYSGTANGVKVGRFEAQDLRPNLLTYLFRPGGVPFFLTAFGAAWGALWGVLRWLRRRPAA